MSTLPIETILPTLKEAFKFHPNVVLAAAPGAGKTTRVPLALLNESWLPSPQRILMLEPRRLAARNAARFMAALLDEQVGETVGYRVRLDTCIGANTRIEVITEGILTRFLQSDPTLEGVGLIIFDEFHERNLHADLGLALCLQSQAIFRADLKILIMSATLDAEPIAKLLQDAPIIVSEGKAFPVETCYLNHKVDGRIEPIVVKTILTALENDSGDIMVFLPGVGEIKRLESLLAAHPLGRNVRINPLHGTLPQEAQDRAIAPSVSGQRKIVLTTSIAETSLTVAGVQVVIDSGLMRVPRFSPRTGMTRLETVSVSKSSADQRRGRAGRLGPGKCYRLWTEQDNRNLALQGVPEIVVADLAPLTLELAAWGVTEPQELQWLDLPPAGAFQQARELLGQLDALNEAGKITAHGRRMVEVGLHPRLAHMVIKAASLGLGGQACDLAAILSERDIFLKEQSNPNIDLRLRLEVLQRYAKEGDSIDGFMGYSLNFPVCRQIVLESTHWKKILGIPLREKGDLERCGLLLAFAYPDRIAERRASGRYLLSNGRGAFIAETQPLSNADYLVAAELDDKGIESRIFLAAAIEWVDLEKHFKDQIETETSIHWDKTMQSVRARKRVRLRAIVLKDDPLLKPNPDEMLAALLQGISEEGLEILPWTRAARQLQYRLQFLFKTEAGWPDVSDEVLKSSLSHWLAPHIYGLKSREDLKRLKLAEIMQMGLTWEQRRDLDEHAPTHILVPSGSHIPIDYSDPRSPILSVRLQEMFGLEDTPRIAHGLVALTLQLLSPSQRPVQVTRDLASFWRETYFEVKKDLKGRYPKHYWPDNPLHAQPTNRTKPR
ncbi:MAG: ATP-dependent helicase HrpB [Bacilli bacterium]|nr:ATP-dependent helicase HrpB [Bacilli bacterium]